MQRFSHAKERKEAFVLEGEDLPEEGSSACVLEMSQNLVMA
jgi:hypothetical protein